MELKIEKGIFKKFKLEEISNALEKGLSKNYDIVKAEVIDCPNLRKWNCPSAVSYTHLTLPTIYSV